MNENSGLFSTPQQPIVTDVSGAPYQAMTNPHRKRLWVGVVSIVIILIIVASLGSWAMALKTSYSLWDAKATPKVTHTSATQGVELGMKFQASVSGEVTGLRFYKGDGNTGTHTGSLWDKNGNRLASITFTNESNTGWQTATFKTPVEIAGNVTYVISYYAPHGHNAVDSGYFNKPFTHGRLTGLNDGWDGGNGVFAFSDSSTFPLSSSDASNYWVDPVFRSKAYGAKSTPSQPVSLQATPSSKSVTLEWLPSVSATPIKSYEIYRDGKLVKTVSSEAPSATTSFHLRTRTVAASAGTDHLVAVEKGQTARLAATTTVNNSASNTATGTNESSKTSQTSNSNTNTTTTKEHYTYTDTNVKSGQTYTYEVKAVDTSKKSSGNTTTKATVPKQGETAKTQPSSTQSNGGSTIVVNNNANNTATGTNESSKTSQTSNSNTNTTTNGQSTTTTNTNSNTTTNTGATGSSSGSTGTGTSSTTQPKTAQQIKDAIKAAQQKALSSTPSSSSSSVWQNYQDNYNWNSVFDDQDWDISGSSSSSSTSGSTSSGSYQYNSNLSNSAH